MKDDAFEHEAGETGTAGGLVDRVADWLMNEALGETEGEALVEGCCERLRAAGIPVFRAFLTFGTLHPLFSAIGLTWHREEGLKSVGFRHGARGEGWKQSPFYHMIETDIPYLRRRLAGPQAVLDFPVLKEFRASGGTDYLAYHVRFADEENLQAYEHGMIGSWTTDRRSGFADHDIGALLRIQSRLAVTCRMRIKDQIARNILHAYLGPGAGRQVLSGQIKRGDGETIHAVIWYCDLRDSTPMADAMPPQEFLAALNDYFECTAGAVLAHGGEVLRFIGDAVLAIFPIRKGEATARQACKSALAAAREAEKRLAKINRQRRKKGKQVLSYGLGLHVGDVMYGNIGVPERLEFSVIGPAANEVARIEGQTKELGRRVLVSGDFANNLKHDWVSLGRQELKGVTNPIEIFGLPGTRTRRRRPAIEPIGPLTSRQSAKGL